LDELKGELDADEYEDMRRETADQMKVGGHAKTTCMCPLGIAIIDKLHVDKLHVHAF